MSYYIPVRCSWEQGGETVNGNLLLGLLIGWSIGTTIGLIICLIYELKS